MEQHNVYGTIEENDEEKGDENGEEEIKFSAYDDELMAPSTAQYLLRPKSIISVICLFTLFVIIVLLVLVIWVDIFEPNEDESWMGTPLKVSGKLWSSSMPYISHFFSFFFSL
jgi:hypothetical protein